MGEAAAGPVEIFFSYAHEDEELMNAVRRQLVIYERSGRIRKWHDRQIPAGAEWRDQIDSRLDSAAIVLLFVSPHFIESRYCYEVEVQAALRRHVAGLATVIPVILRPCSWQETPFARLQVLPRDAKPISQWADRDDVCLQVAQGIMARVDARTVALPSDSRVERPQAEARTEAGADAAATAAAAAGASTTASAEGTSHAPLDLGSFQCTSVLCRSRDLDLVDSVEVSSLKAGTDGWSVHGIVQMEYCVHGRCRTCNRVFQAARRQIPVQFPDLTCNQCDRRAFLQYRVQELKRVAGGFEFCVAIRCSGCEGKKTVTRVLTNLLGAIGITVGRETIEVA